MPTTNFAQQPQGRARYDGRVGALAVAIGIGVAIVAHPAIALADPAESDAPATSSDPVSDSTDETTDEAPSETDDEPQPDDIPEPDDVEDETPSEPVDEAEQDDDDTASDPAEEPQPADEDAESSDSSESNDSSSRADVVTERPAAAAPDAGPQTTDDVAAAPTAAAELPDPAPDVHQWWSPTPPAALLPAPEDAEPHALTAATPSDGVTAISRPVDILTELLTLVTDTPTAPAQSALMWIVAAMSRREFEPATYESATYESAAALITAAMIEGFNWFVTDRQIPRDEFSGDPGAVAVSPDGTRIYVASYNEFGTVRVIDADTMAVIGEIYTYGNPSGVAVNADGTRLYVTNSSSGLVGVYDTTADNWFDDEGQGHIGWYYAGPNPTAVSVGVGPDGQDILYVTNDLQDEGGNSLPGRVTVIDTNMVSDAPHPTIPVGANPVAVSVSPDGQRIFVLHEVDGTLTTIDAETYDVVSSVDLGGTPRGMALSDSGDIVYVTDSAGTVRALHVGDLDAGVVTDVTGPVEIGDADGIAVRGHYIYVTSDSQGLREITANADPVIESPGERTTNTETGTVSGQLEVYDPDPGDVLQYIAPEFTGKGWITIDPVTGAFVYTPTDEARHDAAADDAPRTALRDSFEITISDGHGGAIAELVEVDISPANAVPMLESLGEQSTDSETGAVRGQLQVYDLDGDVMRYAAPEITRKGSIAIDPDTGAYVYTPTDEARQNAAAEVPAEDALRDWFVITITDGHGGVTEQVVYVDILPAAPPLVPVPPGGGGSPSEPTVPDDIPPELVEEEEEVVPEEEPATNASNGGDNNSDRGAPDARRDPARPSETDDPAESPDELATDTSTPQSPAALADAPPPEAGLTSRVETGTQASTVSVVLLAIGGWFFLRRLTSALR